MYDNWISHFDYIKDKEARPCSSFCPYQDTCQHGKNILSTCSPKYHQIEKIANIDECLVGLNEACQDFYDNFNEAVQSNELIWHVIKSQTALGKTETTINLLKESSYKILIAVSTNKLKREIVERAKKQGITLTASPSLHEIKDDLPEDVWNDIEMLYSVGKLPMPCIEKAILKESKNCVKILRRYKKELYEFDHADGSAITTHRRLTSIDVSKYNFVIVDEDALYSFVIPNRETVYLSDLRRLKRKISPTDSLAAKIKKIIKQSEKTIYFTLDEIEYNKSYAHIKSNINIPALCSARHFCLRKVAEDIDDIEEDCISFINPIKFQEKTKYIMLSATVDENICKYYFGEENVRFYKCKEAMLTGVLNQYAEKPMSVFCNP